MMENPIEEQQQHYHNDYEVERVDDPNSIVASTRPQSRYRTERAVGRRHKEEKQRKRETRNEQERLRSQGLVTEDDDEEEEYGYASSSDEEDDLPEESNNSSSHPQSKYRTERVVGRRRKEEKAAKRRQCGEADGSCSPRGGTNAKHKTTNFGSGSVVTTLLGPASAYIGGKQQWNRMEHYINGVTKEQKNPELPIFHSELV